MYRGFLRVASANIKTKLLNVKENKSEVLKYIEFVKSSNIDIIVFPELTLTGISSGDFLSHKDITHKCEDALYEILDYTRDFETIIILGLPISYNNNAISALFTLQKGEIKLITDRLKYSRDELRVFSENKSNFKFFNKIKKEYISIGSRILSINNIKTQIVFESDLSHHNVDHDSNLLLVAGNKPSNAHDLSDKKYYLKDISKINDLALVYAGASNFESSSRAVYSSQKYIIEYGEILEEGKLFNNGLVYNDIKIDGINNSTNFAYDYLTVSEKELNIKREIKKYPYFPKKENWNTFMRNVLEIQSEALARRLIQIPDKKIFLGISGGLDSTLGLIVSSLAFYKLGLDSKGIYTITMPGLGTSDRTKTNATNLAKVYNTTFKEISIKESVLQHFKDIEHDENDTDTTFENAQARERTQVLMDLSNKHGGIVLGTGNMSEIALGWATYNGDHMSMYGVNAGLPKTLLREVVRYVADSTNDELLKSTLYDIIDTPISPELLPTNEEGKIAQKTEDNVGPYELHDFFMYHLVRNKSKNEDIKYLANLAFKDKYSNEEIDKWFNKFIFRFVTQAFKRNVAPDAPQILDYSLDHRSGFVMPSDIDPNAFF